MAQYQPRHKPAPFRFPGPLSPPETIQSRSTRRAPKTAGEALQPPINSTESLRAKSAPMGDWTTQDPPRRTSSIGYFSSGIQDVSHERQQRTQKSFIIVIPPPFFSEEDGGIASLGLGPRHRLSQGLVVPLCTTVSSIYQLFRRVISNSIFCRCMANSM
jgi:hypothetical protein